MITLTTEQADHLLAALTRMEHKLSGGMEPDEHWAAVALAQAVNAPGFIVEYFAAQANAVEQI